MKLMRARLATLLLEKSYVEGEFVLTSGNKSDYYFDCKQTALHPEGAFLIGSLFFNMLRNQDIQGVGGMTLGADPLVTAVSLVSFTQHNPLPGFIVRKTSKGHGTKRYLEGLANFTAGDRVALLEDVVTTGGTLLTACKRVSEAGLAIQGVYCVLDREEGGSENLGAAGYELKSIFTRKALLEAAQGYPAAAN